MVFPRLNLIVPAAVKAFRPHNIKELYGLLKKQGRNPASVFSNKNEKQNSNKPAHKHNDIFLKRKSPEKNSGAF